VGGIERNNLVNKPKKKMNPHSQSRPEPKSKREVTMDNTKLIWIGEMVSPPQTPPRKRVQVGRAWAGVRGAAGAPKGLNRVWIGPPRAAGGATSRTPLRRWRRVRGRWKGGSLPSYRPPLLPVQTLEGSKYSYKHSFSLPASRILKSGVTIEIAGMMDDKSGSPSELMKGRRKGGKYTYIHSPFKQGLRI